MKVKEILVGAGQIVAGASLIALLASPAYAQEVGDKVPDALEVGDKMPDYQEGSIKVGRDGEWANEDYSKTGRYKHYHDSVTGDCKYTVFFLRCKGEVAKLSYGIYDFEENKFYIDNIKNLDEVETSGSDGVIDDVVNNPVGRKASEDAPNCDRKI